MNFNIKLRTKFPVLFGLGCGLVLAVSFVLSPSERLTVTLTLLSAVGGGTAFLYAKHSQEINLFRELFREFNDRYDKLNKELNEIHGRPPGEPLQTADHGLLYDYFNLCAEEQMFAGAGCIDSTVWGAWQNGMRHFAQDPEIRAFWEQELKQDSYYGFKLPSEGH